MFEPVVSEAARPHPQGGGGTGILVQGCLRASFDLVVVNTLIDPRSLLCIKDLSRHFREV